MVTKFYKITNGSETHKKLENCIEQNRKLNEFMGKFMIDNGFETKAFYLANTLIIDPTEADIEKFKEQLMKDRKYFKKNSKLNKAYIEGIKENDIDIFAARGLDLWDYGARIHGGASYRQWIDEKTGIFYLEITPKKDEVYNITSDAVEIKGSEYYQAYENREPK